jgi:BirA family biotin operon repressor/biotin-[acetyl-CoA-carboxylase] ligase
MHVGKVKERLETSFVGKPLIYYRRVSSTNDVGKELAKKGVTEGTVILAETQTKGRGRLGRKWVSPSGGLWFSLILRPKIKPKDLPQLTFMAATAIAKTLRSLYKLRAQIKWPNDILVNNRKVCGILTEGHTINETVEFAVVGVGINVNLEVKAFPSTIRSIATSLQKELGKSVDREKLLCSLLMQIENSYLTWRKEGFKSILKEFRMLAMFLGKHVRISVFDERIMGIAEDLDETGALIVRLPDGTRKKILVGDLEILEL